jgi:hypothetical protein
MRTERRRAVKAARAGRFQSSDRLAGRWPGKAKVQTRYTRASSQPPSAGRGPAGFSVRAPGQPRESGHPSRDRWRRAPASSNCRRSSHRGRRDSRAERSRARPATAPISGPGKIQLLRHNGAVLRRVGFHRGLGATDREPVLESATQELGNERPGRRNRRCRS